MNEKLHNMDSPGFKELRCGCLCQVHSKGEIKVKRACPTMVELFRLAGEKEPDPEDFFSPGDDVMDHIYDGIAGSPGPKITLGGEEMFGNE